MTSQRTLDHFERVEDNYEDGFKVLTLQSQTTGDVHSHVGSHHSEAEEHLNGDCDGFQAAQKSRDYGQVSNAGDVDAAPKAKFSSLLRGFIHMNNYCLLNNCAAVGFKTLLQSGTSLLVLAFFRNVMLFFIALIAAKVQGKALFQKTYLSESQQQTIKLWPFNRHFLLAQIRSLFASSSFLLFMINLTLIPLTLIIIIFQTNPLWSAILGFLVNRERVSAREFALMLASFGCVIFVAIARNSQNAAVAASDGTQIEEDSVTNATSSSSSCLMLGVILCLVYAWLFSGIGVISRRLTQVHFSELMLHQSVQGLVLFGLGLGLQSLLQGNSSLAALSGRQYCILLVSSFADALGITSQCVAFQSESTAFVSVVAYLAIVYALISDYTFFGEFLSKPELLGCAAIIFLTLLLAWTRSNSASQRTSEQVNQVQKIEDEEFVRADNNMDHELLLLEGIKAQRLREKGTVLSRKVSSVSDFRDVDSINLLR